MVATHRKTKLHHRAGCSSFGIAFSVLLTLLSFILFRNTNQMLLRRSNNAGDASNDILQASLSRSVTTSVPKNNENIKLIKYRSIPVRKPGIQKNLVKEGDYIYYKNVNSWDSAPVVMESHKLVFFTIPKVGCTVWKQLFRRMMGIADWSSQDYEKMLPHNPELNGLKYLYDYPLEQASEMMTSPEWTRAMMVRDPKLRFLSAFIDKSVRNYHRHIHRCCIKKDDSIDDNCIEAAQTITGFLDLCARCHDDHWRAQNDRLDDKYWPYLDVVMNVENAAVEAEKLLKRIGAWEKYGKSGWGPNQDLAIFASKGFAGAGNHTNFAQWQVWKWYTPETEKLVEQYYQEDYENPLFNFTRNQCLTCVVQDKQRLRRQI